MRSAASKRGRWGQGIVAGAAVLLAALAALIFASPAAQAQIRTAWGKLLAYDASTGVLTVTADGEHLTGLVYTDKTVNAPATDPVGFPPGPCKRWALEWNVAVSGSSDASTFRALLGNMATKNCPVGYVTVGPPNADGTLDLAALAPVKP